MRWLPPVSHNEVTGVGEGTVAEEGNVLLLPHDSPPTPYRHQSWRSGGEQW